MPDDHFATMVPFHFRLLLALGGRMLPSDLREDWVREWYAELWHAQYSARWSPGTLRMRALGAFADAWFLLRHKRRIGSRLGEVARARSFPIVTLVLLIAGLGIATDGFRRSRDLLLHRDADGLFLLAQPSPFMGIGARIPEAQAKAWMANGKTVEELGRWSVRKGSVCIADPVAIALFSEARMKPQCRSIQQGAEVLGFAGVVGRLRAGVPLATAEAELANTATLHLGWLIPDIVSISRLRRAPFLPVGVALALLAVLSVFALRARTMRACAWALSRIALSFGAITAAWLEFAARAPFTEAAGVPGAWILPLYFFPITAAAGVTLWLCRDARKRCRICDRPLTMPVFVGLSGRCLFDSGGVEYLCGAGHGALVTGSVPGQIATEEWSKWPSSLA